MVKLKEISTSLCLYNFQRGNYQNYLDVNKVVVGENYCRDCLKKAESMKLMEERGEKPIWQWRRRLMISEDGSEYAEIGDVIYKIGANRSIKRYGKLDENNELIRM